MTETRAADTAPAALPAKRDAPWRKLLRGLGWTFIVFGYVLLLFVAYELWGTNLITSGHQTDLRKDLARAFQASGDDGRELRPIPGEALGILRIPSIDVNLAFIEGVDIEDLKKGPGRYPKTALPGDEGNFALAGHRTTYGSPFWSLDVLEPGDRIHVRTTEGRYVYEVEWTRIVDPSARYVLSPTESPALTLTTCNPRFSAAERLIVRAEQVRVLPPLEVG
jgi:sortase A